jgi:hypothetical protein
MIADFITIIVALIAFLSLSGFYVSRRATRLDRLHTRIETARAALEAALLRRCAATSDLAASGALDPASSLLLVNAEQYARLAQEHEERELAESNLSKALRAVYTDLSEAGSLPDEEGGPLPGSAVQMAVRQEIMRDVEEANRRVSVARHFYNDTVAATRAARQKWLARVLNLSGSAEMPSFFEMDDMLDTPK